VEGAAVTGIYGLYEDPAVAQRAVDALRKAGTPDRDIVVMSSEPFEEFEFGHLDKVPWMPWIAGVGGVLGLAGGTWLTAGTQQAWPIVTSGMPIVSPWPNLIVQFELTMLGAIIATVIALILSGRLMRRLPRFYDPEVTRGYILVGIPAASAERLSELTSALEQAGPGRIKTLE
jgi:hypothetical protein